MGAHYLICEKNQGYEMSYDPKDLVHLVNDLGSSEGNKADWINLGQAGGEKKLEAQILEINK